MMPNIKDESPSELFAGEMEIREKILREIKQKLHLSPDDTSTESKGKIYKLIADEITNLALKNVDENEIKTRLGNIGELRLSQYVINFGPQIKQLSKFGTRKIRFQKSQYKKRL